MSYILMYQHCLFLSKALIQRSSSTMIKDKGFHEQFLYENKEFHKVI